MYAACWDDDGHSKAHFAVRHKVWHWAIIHSMAHWADCKAVESDPDKVSGSRVFRDTRVPVSALFENIKAGASIDDFFAWFPGVTRSQVEAVLDHEAAAATAGRS